MGGLGAELVGDLGTRQVASLGAECADDFVDELAGVEPDAEFDVSPSESELAEDTETGLMRAFTIDLVGESSLVGDLATTRLGTRLTVSKAVFTDTFKSALDRATLASALPLTLVSESSEGCLGEGSGEFAGLNSSTEGRGGMDNFREAGI